MYIWISRTRRVLIQVLGNRLPLNCMRTCASFTRVLLSNRAISGITAGERWDHIQLTNTEYDWSYYDDVFAAARATRKSVQVNITPGFDTPQFVFAQIPLCDALFTPGATVPANCGAVTFNNFPEEQRADGNVLPLPWNSVYQTAWQTFLTALNARYASDPAFVAIAVAGPVGGSPEMILPTSANTPVQPNGYAADAMWAALIQNSFPSNNSYQNTDQIFIDTWEQTIDMYEKVFAGITLFLVPDAETDLPEFSQNVTPHADNTLFAVDCVHSPVYIMSCEAKTEILSYFVTLNGANRKATQVGGMTAGSPPTPGHIGVPGLKVLTSLSPAPSPPFTGGADFDFPVTDTTLLQQQGCPNYPTSCPGLTPEQAAYNTMAVFFYGTPSAAYFGSPVGSSHLQTLALDMADIVYAQQNPCPPVSTTTLGKTSLQDLLNRASRDLLFTTATLRDPLPAATCQ